MAVDLAEWSLFGLEQELKSTDFHELFSRYNGAQMKIVNMQSPELQNESSSNNSDVIISK